MVCGKCQKLQHIHSMHNFALSNSLYCNHRKLTRNITPSINRWKRGAKQEPKKDKKDMSKILENLNPKKKKKLNNSPPTITLYPYILSITTYRFKKRKGPNGKCRICKGICHQMLYYYCQSCAYQKGICAMCGKKLHDTSNHCQTNV